MTSPVADAAPDVDVVIVAFNAGELLEGAVASAEAGVASDRVIVVDVGSSDGSVAALQVAHPSVHVIPFANRGFSAGNNVGIAATDGEFVLLLNPDAVLAAGALDALVACAQAHPSAGIVAPRVADPGGGIQMGSYGRFPTLVRVLGLQSSRLAGRTVRRPLGPRDIAAVTDVDWVTGACMLVRRAAIVDVGAMDEGFFLYYEDVEWCHRMRDHGWSVLIEPKAECTHHVGGSGGASAAAASAYRESFYRYCRIYGLWGLAAVGRLGVGARRMFGGRS